MMVLWIRVGFVVDVLYGLSLSKFNFSVNLVVVSVCLFVASAHLVHYSVHLCVFMTTLINNLHTFI